MADRFKSLAAKKDPLSQKVPTNPKYKDVRPTIDTGASMTKYLDRVKDIKTNYKYKKGEIFKRIKVTSLVGLMIEVAEMNRVNADEPQSRSATPASSGGEDVNSSSSSPTLDDDLLRHPLTRSSLVTSRMPSPPPSTRSSSFLPPPPPVPPSITLRSSKSKLSTKSSQPVASPYFPHPSSLRTSSQSSSSSSSVSASRPNRPYSRSASSLQGLIAGIGERTTAEEAASEASKENAPSSTSSSSPLLEPPYLLLDIREEDAYGAGHLRTAKNFPTSRLSRAFQFETKELRSFCNKEGKIIVVYDEDETMAPRAATILVERGYDNVYMLSGGINVARKFFPDGLVLGKPSTPEAAPARQTSLTGAISVTNTPTSACPIVLSPEEASKLRSQLNEAKLASSPAHRPNVQTFADRRRTQMFGAQVKGKPRPQARSVK